MAVNGKLECWFMSCTNLQVIYVILNLTGRTVITYVDKNIGAVLVTATRNTSAITTKVGSDVIVCEK